MTSHLIHAIDPDAAERLRVAHTGPVVEVDVSPGYPCRRCLRDAAVGDRVVLVSHDPFESPGPYRSASPVWLHADGCEAHEPSDDVPQMLLSRPLSVRAFDGAEMMVAARTVVGEGFEAALDELFADPAVVSVHVHNAAPGCWNCVVRRVPVAA
ncbi:MAG: DUF1203 domain-containing protein [Actinomycetota bacterium]